MTKVMPSRKISMACEWMIEDSLEALDYMGPRNREYNLRVLGFFDKNPSVALEQIYELSQAARVKLILAGKKPSRDNWLVFHMFS